jgi:hypothetical protein
MSLSVNTYALDKLSKTELNFIGKTYKDAVFKSEHKIPDPISDKAINVKFYKIFNSKKVLIGFQRHINTTTGCNSACLPVIFDLFYDSKVNLLKLKSKDGLTKKFHKPFSLEDYSRLEMILLQNPLIFKQVKHPTEMVDALSGATLKKYESFVIKEAAYSSLRINIYNQQTLKFIKSVK